MKVITKIRKMTTLEFADFLHYKLSCSDCSDCILNNLDKMNFCSGSGNCTEDIKRYLESKDD